MGDVTKRPRAKQDLIEQATYLYFTDPESDVSERFLAATEAAFARLTCRAWGRAWACPLRAWRTCAAGRYPASETT